MRSIGVGHMNRYRLAYLLTVLGLCSFADAQPPDIDTLFQQLEHDEFVVRERAERRLLEFGRSLVDEAFSEVKPPPESPYGADLSAWFKEISSSAESQVKKQLYDRVSPALDVEGRFRVERIRRGLSGKINARLLELRARYPMELPEDQARLVHGYTGGFRGKEKWFDASYRNGSACMVTAVRVQLRIEHKGKKVEHEILLGRTNEPIQPNGSATWSAEVELPPGATYGFFWRTVAVYGYPTSTR